MEDDNERKIREIGARIDFVRNISLFILVSAVAILTLVVTVTNTLNNEIKLWLLSIGCCVFLGLLVALFLARKDTTITLFVSFTTSVVSGLILGVCIFSFGTQIKS